ncbi:MAG: LPS assembly protein LptD [Magnetococcus sp. MYC-9]
MNFNCFFFMQAPLLAVNRAVWSCSVRLGVALGVLCSPVLHGVPLQAEESGAPSTDAAWNVIESVLPVPGEDGAHERLGSAVRDRKIPIDVNADALDIDQENRVLTATGHVHIMQPGQVELRADQAQYRATANQVEASGHIWLTRQGDLFKGERVLFDMGQQTGTFRKVDVNLRGPGGLATAEQADFRSEGEGKEFLVLKGASFTNCECDPPPWHLTSREVEVDRALNRITAKDVRLYAGDVPVFAFPWWRQPLLPKRESGLLAPGFRVGGNGLEVEAPYYWNIAPDQDATLALRSISRRGLMANAQYRYLDKDYKGQWDASGIFDTLTEQYRGLAVLEHEQRLDQWRLQAHLAGSRSRDYINDFEQKLVDHRSRRLESSVTANRMWSHDQGFTSLLSGVRWYQDLERVNDDHTVQNLPFLTMTDSRLLRTGGVGDVAQHDRQFGRWRLDSEARMDNFYQLAGDLTQRFDVAPVVHFDKPLHVGNMNAVLGVRETAYLLNGDPNQTGVERDETLHRESALAAVRLNTVMRKSYGDTFLHTLEPSVQYVMNKVSDQSRLPNYDASLRNFTVTDIFAHNLYSGIDRVSDAQWLGYSLTSRLLNHGEGNSIWDRSVFSIGQRWAPAGSREYQDGQAFSSVASSLEVQLSRELSATAMMGYNPYRKAAESSDISLSLTLPNTLQAGGRERKGGLMDKPDWIRLGHHYSDPTVASGSTLVGSPTLAGLPGLFGFSGGPAGLQENSREKVDDLTLDSSWRLSDQWVWNQKTDYSLDFSGLKSWETGLVYEHDCWSLRLSGGHRLATTTSKQGGNFIGLFINLQGLGGVGI